MRFLVTAGPTHEHLDPVRYIANASSGRMGYAIAREARRRGHVVTLVSGPTSLRPPKGVSLRRVVSAMEMRRAVARYLPRCHCLVMAAAVSDYRPATPSRRKIPKGGKRWSVPLVRNPDIVAEARRKPGRRIVVGFSLETEKGETRARRKMREKGLDLIVMDDPSAIGSDTISCRILSPNGDREVLDGIPKAAAARRIVRAAERIWEEGKGGRPRPGKG